MKRRYLISVVAYSVAITVAYFVYLYWYKQGPYTENLPGHLLNAIIQGGLEQLPLDTDFAIRLPYSNRSQCQKLFASTDGVVASRVTKLSQAYQPMLGLNYSFDLKCGSCALVSSSGHLLDSGAGAEIDRADCVLRMNGAPSLGFEKDVGRRTTVRVGGFIATKALSGADMQRRLFTGESQPENVVFWGLHSNKHIWARALAHNMTRRSAALGKSTRFYQFTPLAETRADQMFAKETGLDRLKSKSWLSTGFFTMLLVLDICDHVTVYGMIYDDYCKKYPNSTNRYHYHQSGLKECKHLMSNEAAGGGGHRFMTEKAIFGRWMIYRNLTFKYPSWDEVDICEGYDTPFMVKKNSPPKSRKHKRRHK